ncbi:putative linoleate 9S-lipoxygenase [Medicago truncatula]|uniref:Lipoxygenase n=1 Tax=Medicago truncatula TaxID=3880 RepID=G7LIA2_MEDTR|nr:linoleate 9S-lipoxygenase [Medicago truncatula]AET01652.2 seed linoleate 9S-lipoxygenase [Medicago truncatula]RHN39354.1 putative linoleate 9S-lipoxygenase [Medicago truncatula]
MFPNPFHRSQMVKGTVILMQKNVFDIDSLTSATSPAGLIKGVINLVHGIISYIIDTYIMASSVDLRLISSTSADESGKGKVGKETSLNVAGQSEFDVHFKWDSDMGIPGAFYIKNRKQREFFLVSLTLEDVPNHGTINFVCNSWIYNAQNYKTERIFFANKTYLPSETPAPLVYYRQEELKTLRGDGTGERKEWERIYDYDVYNDLGEPDSKPQLARQILGGSSNFPYPRRGRTGREPAKKDPKSESRNGFVYIPRDESFDHKKSSEFLDNLLKSASQDFISEIEIECNYKPEFDTFNDVHAFYDEEVPGLTFPRPEVIQVNQSGWMTDEEFTREMIAGVNPHIIKRLQEFPPKSKLNSQDYGDNTSTITKEQLQLNMDGVTVEEAIHNKRLYILDYQDSIFPYLSKINEVNDHTMGYATRTIIFLQNDGTFKPLAIELSSPNPKGDRFDPISDIYLPASEGVESSIWLLAKNYVIVNDSCYHQLISHWLNTHAVVEPFIIATNRHLSVVHPIHKLLLPHYRDTMNINALARNVLVNAKGVIEKTFLMGSYSLELSAVIYKDWVFTDQGLPNDLLKRGVAVEDPTSPHGLRLLIKDYPYAADGLEIWTAIKSWVEEYVYFYYKSDANIAQDSELQAFWKELVEVGHGDLKDAKWWFKMQTRKELIEACTILIWIASALHAAVNFGQYPYGGYILNRPTKSRRLMPKKGSAEYAELSKNYQKAFLRTIPPKKDILTNLTVIEVLSRHASDEQYLGQRIEGDNWTSDSQPKEAFKRFGKKLAEIEKKLTQRNNDETLRNRYGPVKMPYTLLYPSSEEGLTCRGIPNSISI